MSISTATAPLFPWPKELRRYRPILTAEVNDKGVLDVDTVKGCRLGMAAYPDGGCYGECYAARTATRYGFDFATSVTRHWMEWWHMDTVRIVVNKAPGAWYRIGTAGDPCHNWDHTIAVVRKLDGAGKTPVIITKHWQPLEDEQLERLRKYDPVFNTSVSALDTEGEIEHRLVQRERIAAVGLRSVLRVVTADFAGTAWGKERQERQEHLLSLAPVIDNPLRPSPTNPHVLSGDMRTVLRCDAVGGGKRVSLHDPSIYIGRCKDCPDQCGVTKGHEKEGQDMAVQEVLWADQIEWQHVPSVIGSGFEADVAKLAIEDGIAHRAARKNMQIHSAIVLLINGEFAGFMTFQNNHDIREFCLLQSVIQPDHYSDDLYKTMVLKVIEQNTSGYPALMTTNPKSKFETPKLYKSLGFVTYLAMSGFEYMVHGNLADVRMKLLAHMTMVNVWQTTGGEWLKVKREWNAQIDEAGEREGVANPAFATREGCWQGENGFANVVTGRAHNGNASVLDPVACEVILRFFMPREGRRVYNPFGGGVQFGFVTGACGFEYLASEIRENQCDANNALCSQFPGVRWERSDSATYEPEGMFDLVFTCPPYYRVEKYLDYDGQPPAGEINHLSSYDEFRDTLFAGYRIAIEHLNDGGFFVVMTGDSRDSKGAYHCHEAETELFMRECGLSVYNRIVYVEGAFTRLAHAKKTLNMRKFPKCEQKIIVAYKGDIAKIKERFAPVGRL